MGSLKYSSADFTRNPKKAVSPSGLSSNILSTPEWHTSFPILAYLSAIMFCILFAPFLGGRRGLFCGGYDWNLYENDVAVKKIKIDKKLYAICKLNFCFAKAVENVVGFELGKYGYRLVIWLFSLQESNT